MVIKRHLTKNILDSLDGECVKAIAFAEVGAQGEPATLTIVSRVGDSTFMDKGSFGYEFCGTRFGGDVEIKDVIALFPFLARCVGVSLRMTVRGCGLIDKDKKWFHGDVGFGNHLLILKDLVDDFAKRIKAIQDGGDGEPSSFGELIYWNGLRVIGEMLESQGAEQ